MAVNDSSVFESEIKNRNKSAEYQLMDDILKRDIKVTKFTHSED
jgi:hypothetical protein